MRTTIAVVLGAISLTSAFVFADKPDVAKSANDEVSTLFFGHDDRVPVNDTTHHRGMRLANWKRPAAIYVRRR